MKTIYTSTKEPVSTHAQLDTTLTLNPKFVNFVALVVIPVMVVDLAIVLPVTKDNTYMKDVVEDVHLTITEISLPENVNHV